MDESSHLSQINDPTFTHTESAEMLALTFHRISCCINGIILVELDEQK